ncbi:MAG: DUF1553 domain-containing protein [Fuerstiella sp.]|nr:DUF1553 domain-containing protein [Fuerstiella sp.]MDG2128940.1 DUF1553 domain-containing protein [Fuerstiella sp.]
MRYVLLTVIIVVAGDRPATAGPPRDAAAAIDRLFQAAWDREEVTPAVPAQDAEYFRRLYLDLAGRIPAVSEIRDLLADESTDKRLRVVDKLLDSPASVRHFTTSLRNAFIPQANSQPQFRALIPGFEAWLWQRISEGQPYNQIVHDIITTELNVSAGPALLSTTSPDAFFVVRELKPENLASGTARAFLGVRLDCAQCHDHPFDRWSQRQFWNMAAFYSGFTRSADDDADNPVMMQNMTEKTDVRSIGIPGTEDVVPAVYLTGLEPDWEDGSTTPRQKLANWVVDSENPYFAKMAVNRLWAQFFGRGIVDPVDDFSENNPASHPEVLDLLAEEFINSDYDVKHIVKVITATDVYQLSSIQTHASQEESSHFARATLRGLTPEQFFDSTAEAVGYYQPYRSDNPFVVDMNSPRAQFLDLFRNNVESPLERETTILQALAMMNGNFIDNATSVDDSQTLRAIAEFPAMSDEQKLDTLFLSVLSRRPSKSERRRFGDYLLSGGASENPKSALADVFWVLLNSSEFLLNH